MGSPYRELPKYLICPRCSEMLSREFEGVSSCLRCEGLWITPGTLDTAFGDAQWPAGQSLWWRNSLDCPACSFEGKQTVMAARMANNVLVDQCAEHGLWLDRGELGRLMGTPGNTELSALRDLLQVVAPELERLGPKRDQWRADLETRRRIAAEYRQAQEDEHRRRAAVDEAERVRHERKRAHSEPLPPPQLQSPAKPQTQPLPLPQRLAGSPTEGPTRSSLYQERSTQRAQAAAEIGRLESQLGSLRDQVQRLDAELTRTRYRAMSIERELDESRARMRLLDGQAES